MYFKWDVWRQAASS